MDNLFYRESDLKGNNIELFFHKDFPYLYNPEEFPVIKFTLMNCQNAQSFDFAWLIDDNEGITIELSKENNDSVFEIIDASGEELKIKCESVKKEEMRYREADLYYLINELSKQNETDSQMITKLLKNLSDFRNYINRELEIIDRKINEANWLSIEKQQFLKGQKVMLEKSLEIIGA
jgi:hypothetical protein